MDDMSSEDPEELAALNALGALGGEDLKVFRRLLASQTGEHEKDGGEYDEVAPLIGPGSAPPRTPPAAVKEELMRRIRAAHAIRQTAKVAGNDAFGSGHPDEGNWLKSRVEGVFFKQLSLNEKAGYATVLLRADPGVRFPEHCHSGAEECFVIQGDIHIDDHVLESGDFHHAEPDSHHAGVFTEGGCTLLLVVAVADYTP